MSHLFEAGEIEDALINSQPTSTTLAVPGHSNPAAAFLPCSFGGNCLFKWESMDEGQSDYGCEDPRAPKIHLHRVRKNSATTGAL